MCRDATVAVRLRGGADRIGSGAIGVGERAAFAKQCLAADE